MSPPSFLTASCYVAAGGAAGSWLRFLVARALSPTTAAFPWATLTVNLVGSMAMGLLAGWLARFGSPTMHSGENWRLLLGVGLLGGFTTFSAFSLDFAVLIERGALATAMTYVAASLIGGFGGLFAGLYLMRAVA
ncbi:fluoride efflux transporter CrcB [Novosphingobium sp. JCM 18896]|uniref:fluoride efflux transporter CrcB n=1 Tax=Novosphingobium sp. JCM 18896 TaxID=2989731 RepID=UPI0022219D91|nr:fluoride efflux transporter CrcB [Novosphingobium sp. JCM 18896]MCW1427738.1 fluoride efflux transporter CrcB [Novosphingobium sp. JCM 18896]